AEAAATSIGLINSIGNLGGFVGPYLIGFIETFTGSFILGYSLIAIFFILAIISIYVLKFLYRKS
ncbi:MAG: MFS transporter, partial [Vulcanisaeta sp.]